MLAFRTKVRSVLLAASMASRLATVPSASPARRAVYLSHISHVQDVNFPAISLYWAGGSDAAVQFARRGQLTVDIWVPVHMPASIEASVASGLTGAAELYESVRDLLHMQHRTTLLRDPASYTLQYCGETSGSYVEDFEEDKKLIHISSLYMVIVTPLNAETRVPT